MIINTNVQSLICYRSIQDAGNSLSKASEKISSGYKINSAKDNPAKHATSKKIQSQLKSIEKADKNVNDAISLTQTAEGGMNEVQNIIIRMRELAIQGASSVVTDDDRKKIQVEIDQLVEQVDSIAETCSFNGINLLDGTYDSRTFQIGTYKGETLSLEILNVTSKALNLKDISYETTENCDKALDICDKALDIISNYRATYGAFQTRLEYVIDSLQTNDINVKSALSDIIDADIASEMIEYTTQNVLLQSGISMLAQANEKPNELISLLK